MVARPAATSRTEAAHEIIAVVVVLLLAAGCATGRTRRHHGPDRCAERRRPGGRDRDLHAGGQRRAGDSRRAGPAGRPRGRAHPRRRQVRRAGLRLGRQSFQPQGTSTAPSIPRARTPATCRTSPSAPTARAAGEHDRQLITLVGGPNSVFDADGSALVIHAAPDDFRTESHGELGRTDRVWRDREEVSGPRRAGRGARRVSRPRGPRRSRVGELQYVARVFRGGGRVWRPSGPPTPPAATRCVSHHARVHPRSSHLGRLRMSSRGRPRGDHAGITLRVRVFGFASALWPVHYLLVAGADGLGEGPV